MPKEINRDVNEAPAAPHAGEDLNGKDGCIVLLNNSLVYCWIILVDPDRQIQKHGKRLQTGILLNNLIRADGYLSAQRKIYTD